MSTTARHLLHRPAQQQNSSPRRPAMYSCRSFPYRRPCSYPTYWLSKPYFLRRLLLSLSRCSHLPHLLYLFYQKHLSQCFPQMCSPNRLPQSCPLYYLPQMRLPCHSPRMYLWHCSRRMYSAIRFHWYSLFRFLRSPHLPPAKNLCSRLVWLRLPLSPFPCSVPAIQQHSLPSVTSHRPGADCRSSC